jgi:hypothetical protein
MSSASIAPPAVAGTRDGGGRRRRHACGARIEQPGAGHVLRRRDARIERRVPVPAAGIEPREARIADALAKQRAVEARIDAAGLQHPVHLAHHQQGIDRLPRLGPVAQQQVLPGARAELGEPGVDAVRIGLQQGPVGRGQRGEAGGEPRAQAMDAARLVALQRGGAEQRGKLARGGTPGEIHLEEALLRVHEAEAAGHVRPGGALQDDGAERVAAQGHRRPEAGHADRAVQGGHAAMHGEEGAGDQQEHEDQQRRERGAAPSEPSRRALHRGMTSCPIDRPRC